MQSVRVSYQLHIKVRNLASLILVGLTGIAFGAWSPDLDHMFEGQARTWGHYYSFPIIVCSVVVFAYLCRLAQLRLLNKWQKESQSRTQPVPLVLAKLMYCSLLSQATTSGVGIAGEGLFDTQLMAGLHEAERYRLTTFARHKRDSLLPSPSGTVVHRHIHCFQPMPGLALEA